MKAIALLLLSVAAAFSQTEKWSYTIPGIPETTVELVEIYRLRHDAAGNVAMVVRYTVEGSQGFQLRWLGANGKEYGTALIPGNSPSIISVSRSAVLLNYFDPNTSEVVLQKVTRNGLQSISKETRFGDAQTQVMGLAEPPESPTANTFFIQIQKSPTEVEIKRFTTR